MQNMTPLFPGFHIHTLRKKPRSERQILAEKHKLIKQKAFGQMGDCFKDIIPKKLLSASKAGAHSRHRVFNKANTFWAFFLQTLDADGGCQEVVRKVQASWSNQNKTTLSSSTSAYCQARTKLNADNLKMILLHTSDRLQSMGNKAFHDRRVIVVDGTGRSMPDTIKNQSEWPQQSQQKPGCGFPQAALCACFCLRSGALLSYELGNKKSSELPMLRKQWDTFQEGDIFLGDKGFCSYFDVFKLQQKGVDSVITLARRVPVKDAEALKVLGDNDYLIHWKKPVKPSKASSYSIEEWEAMPEYLLLRQIKVVIRYPGFRSRSFYIVTTLQDSQKYTAKEIADLYFQRWNVELFFKDIKTTIGMDILRCKTPEMVKKEILMHLIVYNCIRYLMVKSKPNHDIGLRKMSFKAGVQALRQWEPYLSHSQTSDSELNNLIAQLHEVIAGKKVLNRPGRSEPRAVKRRPKSYRLLTQPRHEMIVESHRGRVSAKHP